MKVRIGELRTAKGLAQKNLADRTGLSAAYLSQLETGARRLNVTNQEIIARALGVDPSELVDFSAVGVAEVKRATRALESANDYERKLMMQIVEMVEERLLQAAEEDPHAPLE